MKPIERHELIGSIAVELQSRMNTVGINVYLGGFGVKHEGLEIVPSKRVYVEQLLSNASNELVIRIASDLELPLPRSAGAHTYQLESYLKSVGLQACMEDFARASRALDADADQALASASSALESICKALLDQLGAPYPKDQSMQPLLRAVFDAMDLSPERHADEEIKRILGGLFNAGVGIGVLRTKYSAAHGKGENQKRLTARHARLAINAASTVGLFLLETYHERFQTRGVCGPKGTNA